MGFFLLVCYFLSCTVVKPAKEEVLDGKAICALAPLLPCDDWWEDFNDPQLSRCMKREDIDRSQKRALAYEYFTILEKMAQKEIAEELLHNRQLELELITLRDDHGVRRVKSHGRVEGKLKEYQGMLSNIDEEIQQFKEGLNFLKFDLPTECARQGDSCMTKVYQNSCYQGLSAQTDRACAKIKALEEKMEHAKNELAVHKASHELVLLRYKHGLEKYSKIYEVNENYLLARLKEEMISYALKRAYIDFIASLER